MIGYYNDSGDSIVNFDDADVWFSGIRNFAGLTGALLLVGILANAYLLRLTGRNRFPLHWETARLSLRYSSVIDLSLCFVLVPVILWPWVNYQTDVSLTLRCTRFDVDHVSFFGFVLVCIGVVVVCRQVCMLNMFQHETPLINEHGGRTVKLLRDVVILGTVSAVSYLFLPKFAPDIHLICCFVDGWLTSRNVYLFPLPVAVNVILGVIILARRSPPEVDAERQQLTQTTCGDLPDKAIDSLPVHVKRFEHMTHSQCDRAVILAWASLLTWCVLAASMALVGVLLQPSNVGTLFVVVSVSTLHSAWTVYAVSRYWTKPLNGLSTLL